MSSVLKSVAGKSILVTGAASGLGEATARYLVEMGAKVTILDMDEAKGNAVAESLKGNAIFHKTDVSSEESVKAALAASKGFAGPLGGAISCAGIAPAVKVLGRKGVHPLETFQKTINVNLVGTFNVLRLAAEAMSTNEVADNEDRGVIINTASVAAYDGQIGQTAYATSKGGVVAMTLPAARELASNKIRVLTIAPGIMHTPMLAGLPQPAQDSLNKSVPYPARMGNPSEYAALVHHIFQNQYMNGEVIRLDGSIRMAPK